MALNYGSNVDPREVPKGRTAVLRSVALGYSTGVEPQQLPPGAASRSSNWLALHGGLTPRPGLLSLSTTSQFMTMAAMWIGDSVDSLGGRYPVVLSPVSAAVYSNGSWSALSQTGTGSSNTWSGDPNTNADTFVDATMYYNPTSDSFELCWTGRNQVFSYKPFTYKPPSLTFSTLTNAPAAWFVAPFDSRLVFANVDTNPPFPQRVQWSARGNPELYTAPDGGFEDLLDATGAITRIAGEDERLVVFFEAEVWQGRKAPFPFTFDFSRIDSNVGMTASWSLARTPQGMMFLGTDMDLYLIPRGGAPMSVGAAVKPMIQKSLTSSNHTMASATYSDELGAYILTYPTATGTQGVILHLHPQQTSYNPIGFDMASGQRILKWGDSMAIGTATPSTNAVRFAGPQRTLAVDNGMAGNRASNVMEFTSRTSRDLASVIDHRALFPIGNPDPTTRQYLRDIRVDYRADSASSVSVRQSPDFGTTYTVDTALALPVATGSAQSRLGGGVNAIYPAVELRHASGHTNFVIQGLTAVVESMGNG